MSTLQTTLIILGVVIVLAVLGYNTWYSRAHAPRKARPTVLEEDETAQPSLDRREPSLTEHTSPSTVEGAQEPSLDGHPTTAAHTAGGLFGKGKVASARPEHDNRIPAATAASPSVATPQAEDAAVPAPNPTASHAQEEWRPPVAAPLASTTATTTPAAQEFDSLVFSVVPMELEKPVSGDAALAAQPPTRRIGKKQFLIQGLNLQNHLWEPPRPGARYGQFQAAIQLANRQGALNEIEFSEFVLKTQEFADAIGAAPDFPDMLHEVARGREVDHFAAQNDAILNLMVVAQRATWSPGYVRQTAAQYGFKASVTPGRLVLPAASPNAPAVLVLNYDPQAAMADDLDHAPVHEILFTLDVPNVDRHENAFARLRAILDAMTQTMDGAVTDPEGRKLPAMALDSIGADMDRLYDALESRGFPAGSPSALKLFS